MQFFENHKNVRKYRDIVSRQRNIDKIYSNAKDPYEPKYQLLINKREGVGLKHCNDLKAFIEYSNTIDDIYENIINIIVLVCHVILQDYVTKGSSKSMGRSPSR